MVKTIIDIDHLAISRDRITCLMGNGSGKTTLIRLLALVEQPDSGEILFNGEPLPKSGQDDSLSVAKWALSVKSSNVQYDGISKPDSCSSLERNR